MEERVRAVPAPAAPQAQGPAPAGPSGGLLGLQQTAGNRAVVALLGQVQPKLVVGAAGDVYEQEADRIARQIMSRLGSADAATPDGAPEIKRRPAAGTSSGGGPADPEVERGITTSRGGGRPIDGAVGSQMAEAFGRDFSAVRIHTDATADRLNRAIDARAFTLGNDIWFGGNEYQPTTAPGQELLAHELTHVAQQGATVARAGMIQRHASWEHRMLSDVSPDKLKVVVEGRDHKRSEAEVAKAQKGKKPDAHALLDEDADVVALDVDGAKVAQATHVLDEEIALLLSIRAADAELMGLTEDAAKAKAKAGIAGGDHLTLVPVKNLDDKWSVVTYGELNTLADYYGGPAEIAQTDSANFRNIIRGIRERELRGFTEIKAEVEGKTAAEIETAKHADALQFPGAIGDTGRKSGILKVSDSDYAELQLMGKIGDKAKASLPDQPESSYSAGLARNACHFAPYAWHAWAEYHGKAVALAKAAYAKRQEIAGYFNPRGTPEEEAADKAKLLAEADELLRQALIENAFGDHFLQDSFASGHLINKTLIMKWFVAYLDKHPRKEDFSGIDEWRAVQSTAYAQPDKVFGKDLYDSAVTEKSTDPQTAENSGADWHTHFATLGLAVPTSLADSASNTALLFKAWQGLARTTPAKATQSITALEALPPRLKGASLNTAVLALVRDGVIVRASKHRTLVPDENMAKDTSQIGKMRATAPAPEAFHADDTFLLRKEYVPKFQVPATPALNQEKTEAIVHKDYLTFLNHAYLQFSTNVLHNTFCADGLTVANDKDGDLFTIYGDNAMLNKGAAEGVEYSAQTAQLSLAAIKQWSAAGAVDADKTVTDIAKRFPSKVSVAGAAAITIKDWHAEGGPLASYCNATLFPNVASFWNAKSSIVGKGGTVAEVVSKDSAVHAAAGF